MRNKLEVEQIVSLDAFKEIWFTWNNEANHEEAESIYEEFQIDIQYQIDKLFHSFYDKKNNEKTRQMLVEMNVKLRNL